MVACFIFMMSLLAIPLFLDGHHEAEARAKWMKRAAFALLGFGTIAVFVPSKNTIYAIAASEYGEEALKAPEASKAREAINAWLDEQIAKRKPEK